MKKGIGLIGGIVALLFLFGTAHATVWYVHPDSTLNSIQAGLNSCSIGDTVLVAPGIYYENLLIPCIQQIHLISEFGPETTIIDGGYTGWVIGVSAGVDTTTVINGFTIQNGKHSMGGGITFLHASPTITNNIITNNDAKQEYWNGLGGGIGFSDGSPLIIGNTISDNTAGDGFYQGFGGGIYCDESSPLIIGNTITGNQAYYGSGGGIYCAFGGSPIIKHNIICNNIGEGAGISSENVVSAIIDSCSISGNVGSGVRCLSSTVISNNNISDNAGYGVVNINPDTMVNAQYNWWGDPTGPGGVGPGNGDEVSEGVDYDPWLTDSVEWVGIEEREPSQPVDNVLQINPNPFRDRVNIKFSMEHSAEVIELKIYDATGRLVRQFDHTTMRLSDYINWNGTDDYNRKLPSGVYFVKFSAGDYSATEKLLLIR